MSTMCPTGWHVPSDDEWVELEKYVGLTSDFYSKGFRGDMAIKFVDYLGWISNETGNVPAALQLSRTEDNKKVIFERK